MHGLGLDPNVPENGFKHSQLGRCNLGFGSIAAIFDRIERPTAFKSPTIIKGPSAPPPLITECGAISRKSLRTRKKKTDHGKK